MQLNELKDLVTKGESATLELKKSTAQLRRAAETLCGMLNGSGGKVLIGVTAESRIRRTSRQRLGPLPPQRLHPTTPGGSQPDRTAKNHPPRPRQLALTGFSKYPGKPCKSNPRADVKRRPSAP